MFTGIIAGLGRVTNVRPSGEGMVFTIEPGFVLENPELGESIAVNGACLTATSFTGNSFTVDVSPETLSRTTLGSLKRGSRVNLERALTLSERLGGHLVSGHVDAVGEIAEKRPQGRFVVYAIFIPENLDRYLIEKGSVAVDGVSLTVNSCTKGRFSVAIIPHTAQLTTMGFRNIGDKVNIEVDLIGKYIEKLFLAGRPDSGNGASLDTEFLARHGFL